MFTATNCKPHVRELLTALWNLRNKKYAVITVEGEKARRQARKLEDEGLVHILWCAEKGAPRKQNGMLKLTVMTIMLADTGWQTVKSWLKIWRKEAKCARTVPVSKSKGSGTSRWKRKSLCEPSASSRKYQPRLTI